MNAPLSIRAVEWLYRRSLGWLSALSWSLGFDRKLSFRVSESVAGCGRRAVVDQSCVAAGESRSQHARPNESHEGEESGDGG